MHSVYTAFLESVCEEKVPRLVFILTLTGIKCRDGVVGTPALYSGDAVFKSWF
jgi:hypothetical protein